MVLYFRYGTKTVLIHRDVLVSAEKCLHSVKVFSASHAAPPANRLGVYKKQWGDTAGTADPNWSKGYFIAHDIVLSNKNCGEEGGREDVWCYGISLPKYLHGEALLSWKWLNMCLSIPYFALFLHAAFTLPIQLSLSQTISALINFQFSSPSHCRGTGWAAVSSWATYQG